MRGPDQISGLLDAIETSPREGRRRIVALAGAPASGKSTLAEMIATRRTKSGHPTQVVPMDGFHISNTVLQTRGLLHRKGAPETFDLRGFNDLIHRLAHEPDVLFPVFDRKLDAAIVGGGALEPETGTVIVEGNYLLLDEPGWSDLRPHWDLSIALDIPLEVLRRRLIERWVQYGLEENEAVKRAEINDLPNAKRVLGGSASADIVFSPATLGGRIH